MLLRLQPHHRNLCLLQLQVGQLEEIETQNLEEMIVLTEEIQAEDEENLEIEMIMLKEKEFLLRMNSKKGFNYFLLSVK